ncbi:DUF397 domain-containing protein [Nocardia huaxiensis]|uniref:DUF397 domain-containing protein n=1 Tax=Nocardia huaxiensis TaxID=2755382 RepID=UPI001E2FBE27|nr:DUF397 domain-containing protein [Nocardia huaxiensis]UFS94558.1 DUF397 domain-containing protein [Nocardia huaxiensis]
MITNAKYFPDSREWFTSTRTNNGNQCVEVRFDGATVHIRDSKYRRDPANRPETEPVITVTATEWMAFLDHLTGRPAHPVELTAHTAADGHTTLCRGEITLVYTPGEWEAFIAGVRDGEFDRIPVHS